MHLQRWFAVLRLRARSIARGGQMDHELDRELRFHIEQAIEESLAQGMAPEEARFAALRSLGGVSQLKESCRDMRRTNYIENFWQDIRYAARMLAKSPGFAVVIVMTLALGIGANSAVFSIIDAVLRRPLPYQHPDRLVRVFLHSREYPKFPANPFDFRDFRARSRSFDSLAGYTRRDIQLSGTGEPQKLTAFMVTAGYFRVLAFRLELGREFDTKNELPGNDRVVILSDGLWRSRFASRASIIGQTIILNSVPFTVVGIAPPGVRHPGNEYHPLAYGETVDAWVPFTFEGDPANRGSHFLEVIGRLKPSVTPPQAQAALNAIMAQLAREHPEGDSGWQVMVMPLKQEIVGSSRRLLLVLLGAVALVLLIACANAANLLLARATVRRHEIAVRAALGAAASRLIRQMLTESTLIALIGGALAAAIAVAGVKLLASFLPANFPRAGDIHVNLAAFVFTFLIAVVTGLGFGLAPALQSSRENLNHGLHDLTRTTTASGHHLRLRDTLAISEVTLAFVLLIGAGLLLRTFVNLLEADPGFRPQHVLTANVSLPWVNYHTPQVIIRFYDRLLANLNSIPGIESAGLGTDVPWTGYDDNIGGWHIEGKQPPPHQEFHARYHIATPEYFRALGIPLLRGRFFTPRDNMNGPLVLIVNESMARLYWPNENAVGKRMSFEDHPKDKDWLTIVGIVGDVKDAPNGPGAEPAFWWPLLQSPYSFNDMSVVLRSHLDAAALASDLRTLVHQLDASLAVSEIRPMDQITATSFSAPRFTFLLVGLFAALALVLAALGVYGVISYSVNQRTQEFGVRMALGAQAWDMLRFVLAEGMRLAFVGVAAGLICALALARLLGNLLFQVSAADPLTFTAVALLSLAIAALACFVPARRATHADPVSALRAE